MKKISMTLAAMAVIFCMVACEDNTKPETPGNGENTENPGDNGNTETPGDEVEEEEYKDLVTIDGSYDDWAAIDASMLSVAENQEGAPDTVLKTAKVYADEFNINVYLEWSAEELAATDPGNLTRGITLNIYLNADGDTATGGFGDPFLSEASIDVLFQGTLVTVEGEYVSYNPSMYMWSGEEGGSGWNWTGFVGEGTVGTGAGADSKYEFKLDKEKLGFYVEETFGIAFDLLDNHVGRLPNAAITDDNKAGKANPLAVTINKFE